MRELSIIVRREFLERVRSRAFALGTVAFPLFMLGIMLLPRLFQGGGEDRRLAVLSEAPPGIAERFSALLGAPSEEEDANRYVVEPVSGTFEQRRSELNQRVQQEEIDGYVVLPADVLSSNQVLFRAQNIANFGVQGDIRRAISEAVQAERLRQAGLDGGEVAELIRPVEVQGARVTATGEEGGDAETTFWAAYVVAFLIYFVTFFYGVNVMRGVLEEKTNRIAEVMVSSVRADQLMLGKIIGVGAAALLQVGAWAGFFLLLTRSNAIADQFGISDTVRNAVVIDPTSALLLMLFFVLGFFLYAALFAALGAAVTSEQEAQSFQMVAIIPLLVPLLFLTEVAGDPLGTTATMLGVIPFTAPVAMPMRLATVAVPASQIALSVALLLLAIALVGWVAGKIYRIGILSTGKRPTLRELGRWLRAA